MQTALVLVNLTLSVHRCSVILEVLNSFLMIRTMRNWISIMGYFCLIHSLITSNIIKTPDNTHFYKVLMWRFWHLLLVYLLNNEKWGRQCSSPLRCCRPGRAAAAGQCQWRRSGRWLPSGWSLCVGRNSSPVCPCLNQSLMLNTTFTYVSEFYCFITNIKTWVKAT